MAIFATMKEDIQKVFEDDPAARSWLEVILCYPGLHAIWWHHIAHWFYVKKFFLAARIISHFVRLFTGIEIHPGVRIGRRLFIDHGMGIVIGETTEIGNDVLLYQGVVLGGTSSEKGKRHPTIGDRVVIGANAVILGPITIGHDARVGASSVVISDVPSAQTIVGVPGRIVEKKTAEPVLAHGQLPDPVMDHIQKLSKWQKEIEARLARLEK